MEQYNLVLSGLGGQGVMTISRVLAAAASHEGLQVKLFEGTGITQRGGGVHAFVRFGETYSPKIPLGEADAIINLEISEIARVIHYLKPEGQVWTNSGRIHGYFSKLRPDCYPDQERIEAMIGLKTHRLHIIPADRLAQELGSLRTVNMVMMGAFFGGNSFLEAKTIAWAIGQTNRKFATANLDAFWRGYRFSQKRGLRHLGVQEGALGNSPVIEE